MCVKHFRKPVFERVVNRNCMVFVVLVCFSEVYFQFLGAVRYSSRFFAKISMLFVYRYSANLQHKCGEK